MSNPEANTGSSKLKKNILANLLGGTWIVVLTVVITPLQVRLLGMEAYGFIGLIAVLQVVMNTLDFGLSSTVTQAVAADRSNKFESTCDLINSVATMYWGLAILIAVLLWSCSDWVTSHWLKPALLDATTVAMGMQAIAVFLALRWPVAFYTGLISGMQRMDILNVIKSGTATVRLLGGIAVLLVIPELMAFLIWFVISAVLEIAVYVIVSRILFFGLAIRPYFSLASIRKVWKFSVAMAAISAMAMLLTQLDRLIVSKLFSLEVLGYYSLAYNTAIGISLLQTAINSASFPAFSEAHSRRQPEILLRRYDKICQLMGYAIALPCFVLIFFGYDILCLWIDADAAAGASVAMAILALGFYLNAMVSNAYIMSIAQKQPWLPLKVNVVALLLYIPVLFWLTNETGINGAAACWTLLNLYYFFTLLPQAQIGLLRQKVMPWLSHNFFPFLLTGLVVFGGMKILLGVLPQAWAIWPALIASAVIYAFLGFRFLSGELSTDIHTLLRQVSTSVKPTKRN